MGSLKACVKQEASDVEHSEEERNEDESEESKEEESDSSEEEVNEGTKLVKVLDMKSEIKEEKEDQIKVSQSTTSGTKVKGSSFFLGGESESESSDEEEVDKSDEEEDDLSSRQENLKRKF